MLVELKQCFMEAYDDNQDGKIDIREVSLYRLHILPQLLTCNKHDPPLHRSRSAFAILFPLVSKRAFEHSPSPNAARCWWRSWLRHCATSRKVAGSIPVGVIDNLSDRTMALDST
jgi:hypothetical protein